MEFSLNKKQGSTSFNQITRRKTGVASLILFCLTKYFIKIEFNLERGPLPIQQNKNTKQKQRK